MSRLAISAIVCLLILTPLAHAVVSLGAVQPVKEVEVGAGQEFNLSVYLFNLDQPQHVSSQLVLPAGWQGWVEPEELLLSPSIDLIPTHGHEYLRLKEIEGYVRLAPITLHLRAPTIGGRYALLLRITTLPLDAQGVEVSQQREFRFDVQVKSTQPKSAQPSPTLSENATQKQTVEPNPVEEVKRVSPPLTGEAVLKPLGAWRYVAVILLIGLALCLRRWKV